MAARSRNIARLLLASATASRPALASGPGVGLSNAAAPAAASAGGGIHGLSKPSPQPFSSHVPPHSLPAVPSSLTTRHFSPIAADDAVPLGVPSPLGQTKPGDESISLNVKGVELRGRPLYLDMQATSPVDPRVLDAMLPFYLENYGNPHSRTHLYG